MNFVQAICQHWLFMFGVHFSKNKLLETFQKTRHNKKHVKLLSSTVIKRIRCCQKYTDNARCVHECYNKPNKRTSYYYHNYSSCAKNTYNLKNSWKVLWTNVGYKFIMNDAWSQVCIFVHQGYVKKWSN